MIDFKDQKLLKEMTRLGLSFTDFEEKLTKGSGKGGQKVNKSVNCVLLKHLPTGLEVRVHKHRELSSNRLSAYRLLVKKIDFLKNGQESKLIQKRDKLIKQKKRRARRTKLKVKAPS